MGFSLANEQWLTFAFRLARRWCRAWERKQGWRSTGRDCSRGFSNKSTIVSIGMIWTVPSSTPSIGSGNTGLSLPLEACLAPSPTICFALTRTKSKKTINYAATFGFNLFHCHIYPWKNDSLVQGWCFVVVGEVHLEPHFGCDRAHLQHPCRRVVLGLDFLHSIDTLKHFELCFRRETGWMR